MHEISELSVVELDAEHGEHLPAREVMALVNLNTLVAANAAVAANVLTSRSVASAGAFQFISVRQS